MKANWIFDDSSRRFKNYFLYQLKNKMKNLAIIVEDSATQKERKLSSSWFQGLKGTPGDYAIETPLGDPRTVKGILLDSFDLSYITSEFFYLDLTNECNFNCGHCGIKKDVRFVKMDGEPYKENARYVTSDFIEGVAKSIGRYPLGLDGYRKLFYGGGEPLISPKKFAEINHAFDSTESTIRIVVTNGLGLPIDEPDFVSFMDRIGNPHIMLTYTESHASMYAALAAQGGFSKWVPDIEPCLALPEKIRLIGNLCQRNDLNFVVNSVYPNGQDHPRELREIIMKNAIRWVSTEIDGHKEPCPERRETAIRFNGDIYPHCYDAFSGKNKLGVIGFLK